MPASSAGLPNDAIANVTQLRTLERDVRTERYGKLPTRLMAQIDAGLKLVLDLA